MSHTISSNKRVDYRPLLNVPACVDLPDEVGSLAWLDRATSPPSTFVCTCFAPINYLVLLTFFPRLLTPLLLLLLLLLLLQEIVNGAAIQAKIPTALVREQEGDKIACTSGSMDCVVSVYGFSGGVAAGSGKGGGATVKGLASEVARVLKPGGSLLFVEKGEAKELVREIKPGFK